jgi:hypothetical protein
MKLHKRLWLGAAFAVAAIPLMASSSFAACPGDANGEIALRDALGVVIADTTTPYSPKMTCMGTGVTGCHTLEEYASSAHKEVTKTQGVLDSDGEVYWQSYNVSSREHGAVTGRHSQQGRNESYSIAMKTAFGDPLFTSSPGMYGKF